VVTLKHWDAYSLEDADGYTRHNFNAIISNFTLADTYFPAFKATVQNGSAMGVMCSYNSINGVPTCANQFLNNVLRKEWGFAGYITSDTGAVSDIYKQHNYTKDGKGATCAALKDGGCDINSGSVYSDNLLDAVSDPNEKCNMEDVKVALRRTLGLRFRLGLFDPIDNQKYWHVSPNVVQSEDHKIINHLATLESLVLLQNDPKLGLPFVKGKTVAVIGPHTNASAALVGNYLGQLCPNEEDISDLSCVEKPFDAIKRINIGGNTVSSPGCGLTTNITNGIENAINIAKEADYVVLMLGIDQSIEGESHDRQSIDLPSVQHDLATAILRLGKPSVMVLINGGMVAIEEEKSLAPSIVEAFYPGFYGATAIGETIFGDNQHLGGKLPITIYDKDYINQVKMTDMSFKPHDGGPGRSYRYYTGKPLYSAFTGLSLTTFDLTTFNGDEKEFIIFQAGDKSVFSPYSIKVTNTGTRAGDEVVFMFASSSEINSDGLIRRLTGFERVHLLPGESKVVNFSITVNTLKRTNSIGDIVSTPGDYVVSFTTGGTNGDMNHVNVIAKQKVRIESKPSSETSETESVILERFPKY
jgi:beta-D-xylosidase 4